MNLRNAIIAVLGLVILAGIFFIFAQKPKDQPNQVLGELSAPIASQAEKPPAPVAGKIVKMTADSVHYKKPDGTIEANFYTAPINYQDAEGNWHPIDTTLKLKGDIYKGEGTQVSVGIDGTIRVDGMNLTQRTSKIGYFNPDTKNFTPIAELKEGKIEKNKFIRQTGSLRHELTLSEKGLKEDLILSEKPTGWKSGDLMVMETQVSGMNLPQGWLEKDFRVGDLIFPAPTSEDAKHSKGETKRFVKEINGTQYLFTGVPVSWLAKASYPVVIDPNFTGHTDDGYVYGDGAIYSTARSDSVGFDISFDSSTVGQYYWLIFTDYYLVSRNAFRFNTSTILSSVTINTVNLKLYLRSDASDTDFDVQIVDLNWSAPITAGNREAFFENCLSGTTDQVWINTNGKSLDTLYTSPNLSTASVTKEGYTGYCLRSSRDKNNNTPTGFEYVSIYSADWTGDSTYLPVLAVTYTISPPSTPDLNADTDLGSSSTDNITSDNTPNFYGGSCSTGTTVNLYDGPTPTPISITTCGQTRTSSSLSDGAHSITAKASDANSVYSAASGSLSVTIDATAPTTSGTPSPTDFTLKPTFTWTASTDIGGSGIWYYQVDWSQSSTFSTGVFSSSSVTASCALSTTTCGGAASLVGGTWYVRVKAFDVAGNSSSFASTGPVSIPEFVFQGVDMQGIDIR